MATTKRNDERRNAKELTPKRSHTGAGKNSSLSSQQPQSTPLSLSVHQLTKGDNRSIYHPRGTTLLHVSLSFPHEHTQLTKGKQTLLLTTSALFPFLSGRPYRISASCSIATFLHGKCFPDSKHTPGAVSICLTPQRISHDKQAHPRKLTKQQRKYQESMASSIIFNID